MYEKLHLTLNPQKSDLVVYSMAPGANMIEPFQKPKLDENQIQQETSLRYLGVTVDSKLGFGLHTQMQAAKAKKAVGALL